MHENSGASDSAVSSPFNAPERQHSFSKLIVYLPHKNKCDFLHVAILQFPA
jgi:hypothetical protein